MFEIIQPPISTNANYENPETILRAMEFEKLLFETAARFGVRIA
ncbi:hypothetical protein LEP1GSC168_0834 [Leptospira santarosai str. HAI134]|nr:hypothetical protein LEP1GSC168_0834 [Leptospira santarosai str. HAI134]